MVGDDGQTHMGLYDIPYMLAVPNLTVTAPRDGAEMIGLLRCALAHQDGPFSLRYPRDKAPTEPPLAAEVKAVPYGTWEMLRQGRQAAILAVGVMCAPALEAADALRADGLDVSVVNARFLKPLDRAMLEALVRDHKLLVTVEDGCVVNGFGAYLAEMVQTLAPDVRVIALGAPDRTYEHAPRPQQLAEVGLTAEGIAARIRALHAEEAAVS
jgi:1-deoxy-D-xylulose-5-phosphate synthase